MNMKAKEELINMCVDEPFEEYLESKKEVLIKNIKFECYLDKFCMALYVFISIMFVFTIKNPLFLILLLFLPFLFGYSAYKDLKKSKIDLANAKNGFFKEIVERDHLLTLEKYQEDKIKDKILSKKDLNMFNTYLNEMKEEYGSELFNEMIDVVERKTGGKITDAYSLYILFSQTENVKIEAEKKINDKKLRLKTLGIKNEELYYVDN